MAALSPHRPGVVGTRYYPMPPRNHTATGAYLCTNERLPYQYRESAPTDSA